LEAIDQTEEGGRGERKEFGAELKDLCWHEIAFVTLRSPIYLLHEWEDCKAAAAAKGGENFLFLSLHHNSHTYTHTRTGANFTCMHVRKIIL
jgi:hypothetical protein